MCHTHFLGPTSTKTCDSDTQENAGAGRGRAAGIHATCAICLSIHISELPVLQKNLVHAVSRYHRVLE